MWRQTACDALKLGKRLELRYDGFTRVVEVHTVSTAGNEMMNVYQVRGGSNSDEKVGFKNMRLDEAFTAAMIDEKSDAPRTGYKRGAKPFATIFCQL